MLSAKFQADMPANMYVYPVVAGVAVPDEFTKYGVRPAEPLALPAAEIATNREKWIKAWTAAVVQ